MEVIFHKTFEKKFAKLPKNIQRQASERIYVFSQDPMDPVLNNHSVEKRFPGCRSINITGDYRAIFKTQKTTAIFINIGSHSNFYS